jgi:uncharacterized protein
MKTPGFQMSRRRFLGGVSFAAAGTLAYAHLFEAEWLQKSFVTVPLSGGARPPVKLLHLSDMHASPVVGINYIRRAIEVGLQWKPDLICVTGDFITRRFADASGYAEVLRLLSRRAPTFASLGNHDGGRWAGEDGGHENANWVAELLANSGIALLRNSSTTACVAGRDLNLVGLGDLWAADLDAQRGFKERREGETILLSHNPDTKEHVGLFNWHLMLSGHTHGGQLRVPWFGATPFAPVRDKRFVSGLHRWDGRWIHITKGIGSVFGLRINCPPEVSFLTLT